MLHVIHLLDQVRVKANQVTIANVKLEFSDLTYDVGDFSDLKGQKTTESCPKTTRHHEEVIYLPRRHRSNIQLFNLPCPARSGPCATLPCKVIVIAENAARRTEACTKSLLLASFSFVTSLVPNATGVLQAPSLVA